MNKPIAPPVTEDAMPSQADFDRREQRPLDEETVRGIARDVLARYPKIMAKLAE